MSRAGFSSPFHRVVSVAAVLIALVGASLASSPAGAARSNPDFTLTILHNNDAESQLINVGPGLENFGGAARFKTLVDQLKEKALAGSDEGGVPGVGKRGVVMLSSGDNFLAGPEFNASLDKGPPFFDTIAMDLIGYDAVAMGNHDFDFGPDVLADFIEGFQTPVPFLSSNLDVSGEPRLAALEDQGRIAESVVIREKGERIGIVGATTPALRFISSPRNVQVIDDVGGEIQAEVDRLEAQGVNKIILISHLQSIQEDLALAPELSGVDVMVAGGGDELLANPDDRLIPGDEGVVFAEYPLFAEDADGNQVPVITTSGEYRYVGRLVAGFDGQGRIITVNSGPVRVSGVAPDAVAPDPQVLEEVTEPVQQAIAELASNVIGTSEVALDGLRASVRSKETNEGNLLADALLDRTRALAPAFGVPEPDVALQNGGGIRNNAIIPPGDITELDTFDIAPFPNFVSVVPAVPAAQFKEILENAVSRVEFGDGRFAQVAGFTFTWDATGTAQILDAEGNVVTPGARVREVHLDDGAALVTGGAVVSGAPAVDVATIDFLARGGDQYPFRGADFTTVGITYQQALKSYIESTLAGLISAAQYPEGSEGRITRLN